MADLTLLHKLEKNRLESPGIWLILLEIIIDNSTTVRLVNNNENITWNSETWNAFPFQIGDITEDSSGEIPSVSIKVCNLTGVIMGYLEDTNGGENAKIIMRIVHSEHLDLDACYEEELAVKNIPYDDTWVEFKLGADYVSSQRTPLFRYMKDFCPYPGSTGYCGIECGLDDSIKATYPTCNGSLAECRERSNSVRFGGEPSLPGGLYVG